MCQQYQAERLDYPSLRQRAFGDLAVPRAGTGQFLGFAAAGFYFSCNNLFAFSEKINILSFSFLVARNTDKIENACVTNG